MQQLQQSRVVEDRFAALDGLRGIVAVSVLFYHVGHWLGVPFLATNSGLAVDFFFCLSGFVLAHAYTTRLDQGLSIAAFMELRLRRLMPLLALATLVGAAYVTLRALVKHESLAPSELAVASMLGALNLPYFNAPRVLGGPQVFPLNGPQYTLFFEVFVNAFWAASSLVRRPELAVAVALSALICIVAPGEFGGDVTSSFWMGFPRVLGTFYLGVLAYYLDRRYARLSLPRAQVFWSCVALTLVMFYSPVPAPFYLNIAWIALVAPVLVFSGAGVVLTGRVRSAALTLGTLSYPLYILHYPLFCWINGACQLVAGAPDALTEGPILLCTAVTLSFLADHYYDRPIRRMLAVGGSKQVRPALIRR